VTAKPGDDGPAASPAGRPAGQPGSTGPLAGHERAGQPESRAPGHERPGEPDGAGMSYEQARDQLVEVVRRLEGGGLTLEESLALWERGERLAAVCSDLLEGARARLAAAMPEPAEAGQLGEPEAPF
jgi:exodeoxyribonuclease VII small subunit